MRRTHGKASRLALLAALLPASGGNAAEREGAAGWRGNGRGEFPEAEPVLKWNIDNGRFVLWRTKLDFIYSSPVAVALMGKKAGVRVFTMAELDRLIAVDGDTGEMLWETVVGFHEAYEGEKRAKGRELFLEAMKLGAEKGRYGRWFVPPALAAQCKAAWAELGSAYHVGPAGHHRYTAPTPACDGKSVYAVVGTGAVGCYGLDGKRRWVRHHVPAGSASPVLFGDAVAVTEREAADRKSPSCLLALRRDTGKTIWRAALERRIWGTPVLVRTGKRLVLVTDNGEVVDTKDGAVLGCVLELKKQQSGGSPTVAGDVVYIPYGQYHGVNPNLTVAVKLAARELWKTEDRLGAAAQTSPLVVGDRLVVTAEKRTPWIYATATGKELHRTGPCLPFSTWGHRFCPSPTLAGKHVFLPDFDGRMYVLRLGKEWKIVAENHMGDSMGGSPFFQGKRMYVRTVSELICIGEE